MEPNQEPVNNSFPPAGNPPQRSFNPTPRRTFDGGLNPKLPPSQPPNPPAPQTLKPVWQQTAQPAPPAQTPPQSVVNPLPPQASQPVNPPTQPAIAPPAPTRPLAEPIPQLKPPLQVSDQRPSGHKKLVKRLAIVLIAVLILIAGSWFALKSLSDSKAVQTKARDTKRQNDIKSLQIQIENYANNKGQYPGFSEINSNNFRQQYLSGSSTNIFKDPQGTSDHFVQTAQPHVYFYQVKPTGCDNQSVTCTDYTVGATLEAGKTYTKSSPK